MGDKYGRYFIDSGRIATRLKLKVEKLEEEVAKLKKELWEYKKEEPIK